MLIFSYENLWAKITNNSERTKYPAMFFWIQHKQKAGCKADNVTRTRAGHPDKACFIVLSTEEARPLETPPEVREEAKPTSERKVG